MVGRLYSFWEGLCSGVFQGVQVLFPTYAGFKDFVVPIRKNMEMKSVKTFLQFFKLYLKLDLEGLPV